MRVIGIRCTKDKLAWIAIEGESRTECRILEHSETSTPGIDRGEQLAWTRKEILELVTKHRPDRAALRVAEGGQSIKASLGRAEMDGVIQASLYEAAIPTKRYYAASARSAFGAKTSSELDHKVSTVPVIAANAKVRREQLLVAVAELPE